jgi:arginase
MHGMPLSFLLGIVKDVNKYPAMDWFSSSLHPKDLVYIGLRDLDAGEKAIIKELGKINYNIILNSIAVYCKCIILLGIKAYTMYDIDRLGIAKIMEETTAYLSNHTSIHLSYDIDALDPFFAPSTGTAVRGGLTFREGNYICEYLSATGKLSSMELVEINPSLHTDLDAKKTIDMALTLIGSTMGQTIL